MRRPLGASVSLSVKGRLGGTVACLSSLGGGRWYQGCRMKQTLTWTYFLSPLLGKDTCVG